MMGGKNAKNGIFSPAVKVLKSAMGEKELNEFRAKVISQHSKVIGAGRTMLLGDDVHLGCGENTVDGVFRAGVELEPEGVVDHSIECQSPKKAGKLEVVAVVGEAGTG